MSEGKASFEISHGGMPMGVGSRLSNSTKKLKNPKLTLKRLLSYMSGEKWILFYTFFLCMITAIINVIGIRIDGYAVDNYIDKGNIMGLLKICVILILLYLVSVGSTFIQNRQMVKLSQNTASEIRRDLYRKIQMLPVRYFDTHSSGDLMSRLTNDVDNINMTLSQTITQLFSGVITIIGMLLAMVFLSPILLIAGLLTMPLVLFVSKLIVKKTQPYFIEQQKELGNINGFIEERISGQKLTILFGKEEQVKEEFSKINIRLKKSGFKSQAFSGLLGPANNMINNLTYFVVAVTGAYLILSGSNITVGVVFTFILYMRNFIQPINQILNTFNIIQSALAGAERVFEIMDEPKEEYSANTDEPLKLEGRINFNKVNFSYQSGKEILKNVSLTAKKGQTIAIVGPTGSGKTTIVNLLTRFYDIEKGEILIDDDNIINIDKHDLRQNISMVLQDTFLFAESVRQNIRYGRLSATDQEVEEAARIANAHRFIVQLPNGYDTILSDNGSNLSHGQKQLLAIARAVLAHSSILILDEATSSIDTQTELAIQKAMLKLMEGRTTFIIAHRLSTIRNADMILALDKGEIIERGTHEELMKIGGFYAELCNSQYKGISNNLED